jgi:hypothetical protein
MGSTLYCHGEGTVFSSKSISFPPSVLKKPALRFCMNKNRGAFFKDQTNKVKMERNPLYPVFENNRSAILF